MKKKIKIAKIKVFNIKGHWYSGFEADGADYVYIRSNSNGYYEFAKPEQIVGLDNLGRTKTSVCRINFHKYDFANVHELYKVVHYDRAILIRSCGADIDVRF